MGFSRTQGFVQGCIASLWVAWIHMSRAVSLQKKEKLKIGKVKAPQGKQVFAKSDLWSGCLGADPWILKRFGI